MDFVKATSRLTQGVTLGDLADELGVTTVDLSRARSHPSNRYHRSPPEGWEAAVVKLARQQADQLKDIARTLKSTPKKAATTTSRSRRATGRKRPASRRR